MKGLFGEVKEPSFQKKIVVTFIIRVTSYELETPTADYKLSSIKQKKEGKKYSDFLNLSEVQ